MKTDRHHQAKTASKPSAEIFVLLSRPLAFVWTGMPKLGLLLLATAALLAFTATSAPAAIVYPKVGEIPNAFTGFTSAGALAVNDHNGHIYVADSENHVIRDYASAADTSPTLWDGSSTPAGPFTGFLAVAVDNSSGDIYVSDAAQKLIDKFDQDGNLIASFGDSTPAHDGQLAGLQTPAGSFLPPAPIFETSFGIAVDQATGDLYAIDAGHEVIDVFDSAGTYLKQITATPGELYGCQGHSTNGIAVNDDSGELLLSDSCDQKVYRFELASGTFLAAIDGSETPAGNFGDGSVSVAAADSTGSVYVTDSKHEVVDVFDSSAAYQGQIVAVGVESNSREAVAVDQASGEVYVAKRFSGPRQIVEVFRPTVVPDVTTKPASALTTTSATLNGEVNPDEIAVTECFFEYGETTAYGEIAACEAPDAAEIGAGNSFVPVHADIENLTPGATYHYRLVAANADGQNNGSGDQVFFTGASIDSTSVSEVSAATALLEAELNPHGLPTTYRFEYDTAPYTEGEAPHGESTPTASAGSGESDVTRIAQIGGLQPSTTYHYRVVAENVLGTVEGPDRAFTTQPAAASTLLPDGRGYELVSPPNKHGAPLEAIRLGDIQAAADGDAIAYVATGPIGEEAAGSRSASYTQLLSQRGPTGWSTTDIATPHQVPVGSAPGDSSEYELFSSDLSLAAVEPFGDTPLSPSATNLTPYRRQADGSFTPLVYPGNVPTGTKFGEENSNGGDITVVHFVTATPDLGHMLLSTFASLVPGFENSGKRGIYEWSEGSLAAVSLIPPSGQRVCGGAGPACVPSGVEGAAAVGNGDRQVRNALSADGSRAVFMTDAHRLYLRDLARGETLRLDAAQGLAEPEVAAATFQLASADGSRIFFTDPERLTADSTAASQKPDLYMCEVEVDPEEHLACALTDLTANHLDPAEPAAVLGAVIGAAADGSSVYFVANGALTEGEGAVHGDCTGAVNASQSCNLYRYDLAAEEAHLVAVLSGADSPDWRAEGGSNLGEMTARVSPNGRWLAFMSQRGLTGYDNRDAATGASDQEVFLYDAATDQLHCASCNPSGARPRGVSDPGGFPGLLVDRSSSNWGGQTLAASIPGWTRVELTHALYQSRYLSDSGRLFFNAADALAPQDTNGTFDVYQYEPPQDASEPPPGDTCTTTSNTYSPRSGGCLSLLTSGTSPKESAFLDASESGDDVFFLTASRLSPRDVDGALDLYDARVNGGEPQIVKPIECSGDACQQPAVPPNDPTPGSLTFNGVGNLLECPNGKVKRSGKCVKQKSKKHKKHHKQKSHKRANSNGGGHK